MSEKTMQFAASKNSIDLLYDDNDISIVSLDLLHQDDGPLDCNRNHCHISHEVIENSLDTFRNKPIIFRLSFDERRVTEHARNELEAKKMRVGGIIPNDAVFKFVERDNGKTYLNTEAILYKRYCPQLIDILERNEGELEISIEIRASGTQDDENDIFFINDMSLQGVCILDPSVPQGIEGSNIKVLRFTQNDMDSMNERYIAFSKRDNSRDSIFNEIKHKIQQEEIMNSLSVAELSDRLWKELHKYEYHNGDMTFFKYYIEEIYPDDKEIIVNDTETGEYYKVPYSVDDGVVTVDIDRKTAVEKGWHERPANDKRFAVVFAKEEYGTGEAVTVDKSSEAVSNKAWGDVDKTELRHKVLTAKNYKSLVYDVYALVEDGWEDSPSSKLKYPIMLIEGNKAVYSRYGLASALAYAKGENETAVISKVEKLYKELKIEEKEDEVENQQIENQLEEEKDVVNAEDTTAQETATIENAEQTQTEEVKNSDEGADCDDGKEEESWEKKYSELEEKFKCMESEYNSCKEELESCKNALNTYKVKEDQFAMTEYLNTYKKCFSEDEYNVMASKIENAVRADFEKEVDEKVKTFVRDLPDNKKEEEKDYQNSLMHDPAVTDVKTTGKRTLQDVLNDCLTK